MTNGVQRSQRNRPILRSSISAAMALAASALLLGGDAEYKRNDTAINEPKVVATPKPESSKLSNERYIRSIAEKMPSYQRAKAAGVIDGILFEPSDNEIKELLRNKLMTSMQGLELEIAVSSALEVYNHSKKNQDSGGTVIPALYPLDSAGIKRTLVLFQNILDVETIKSGREIKNVIEHELVHAEDFFNGVGKIDSLLISVPRNEWDLELWRKLLELRAQHRTMEDIMGIDVNSEVILFDKGYIAIQVRRYYRLWSFVTEYKPKSELWGKFRDSQLEAAKDISPRKEGLRVLITRKRGEKIDGFNIKFESESQLAGSF